MGQGIWRALLSLRLLFGSRGPGRHSRAYLATRAEAARAGRPAGRPVPAPPAAAARQRDPYVDHPLFGGEPDIVRPYVLLYEQQRERERNERMRHGAGLYLPLCGVDPHPACTAEVAV